jgi:hypothetical protein
MKQFVVVTFALGLLVTVSGCGSSPKDMIIGKWETTQKQGDVEVKITVEFTKDEVKMSAMGLDFPPGKYKWVDNDNIEVTMKGPDGKEKTEKSKVKVTKDELEMPDPEGKVTKFKRAK